MENAGPQERRRKDLGQPDAVFRLRQHSRYSQQPAAEGSSTPILPVLSPVNTKGIAINGNRHSLDYRTDVTPRDPHHLQLYMYWFLLQTAGQQITDESGAIESAVAYHLSAQKTHHLY
ncbi:hypothetical protein SB394_26680 [Burkholderia sp. BCCIQ04A]|uniref:Uncharacterized protein n=1 Tax=Burkholderia anthinoferrum TaxID=3090833 RepID=A0ABU5WIS9_9BURK|nr:MULTISPECIES: hypothetical protein [Burkholderia]MEB2503065.1 hypothetical protein [Burkholderia anthinoferrum]MEB2532787.1 hypothetical protein [Burkholderia anthinoferrum]MEB2560414.1 hypothetical protein [Burkholderia anthinoferrum]MEB2578885.1 hypothetical protein [Burkholderia anthinoferrum]MCA8108869.1 hypothetical protein [Burkholderia sp. AU36459]